jgi:SH3 domain protein
MFRRSLLPIILLFTALPLSAPAADVRYVTDSFEVTMRSGTSTQNSIVRLLRSGERVTVLENDPVTQYSLIESEDGKQGYVLSRFLMDAPAARQVLTELRAEHEQQQARLEQQTAEITELKQSLQQEQADNTALKTALRASEQELADVRASAQNTLNILEQNKSLQSIVEQLREEKTVLTAENDRLSDSTRMDWFVRGAAVSLIAFVIGIVVTRIRWRKRDSWGSY